jgi:hypothetical protein
LPYLPLIGHGKFDVATQDGQLLLKMSLDMGRPLSGQYLGTLLHDEDSLRRRCELRRRGRINDPFAAQLKAWCSRVCQPLPCSSKITKRAAITLPTIYAALADGPGGRGIKRRAK